jgi:hypothetical protein
MPHPSAPFLSIYLFIVARQVKGNAKETLLGKRGVEQSLLARAGLSPNVLAGGKVPDPKRTRLFDRCGALWQFRTSTRRAAIVQSDTMPGCDPVDRASSPPLGPLH